MYGTRIGTKVFGKNKKNKKKPSNLKRLKLRLWSKLELGLSFLVQVI
jgi:hypothetical protein